MLGELMELEVAKQDAEADMLAFLDYPAEHRSKLRSTNSLERVDREIGRRPDVIGIHPRAGG